jgi:hypothetical protein
VPASSPAGTPVREDRFVILEDSRRFGGEQVHYAQPVCLDLANEQIAHLREVAGRGGRGEDTYRICELRDVDAPAAAVTDREAHAQAFRDGYARAIAILRDDARYDNWWSAREPEDPRNAYWERYGRTQLADYLEMVEGGAGRESVA